MKILFLFVVILGLTDGFPKTGPRHGGRTPQNMRERVRDGRIVGGEPAQIEQFPHMLALFDLRMGGFICGASVIHTQWSLSAGKTQFMIQ